MSQLLSLRLRDIKSWGDTGHVRLAPITGLFGTNSSGKTSLLQMLLLMKQTIESTDRAQVLQLGGDRAQVDVGTFHDLVHGRKAPGSIEWELAWSLPEKLVVTDPAEPRTTLFTADELSLEARVVETKHRISSRTVLDWFRYRVGSDPSTAQSFGMKRSGGAEDQYELTAKGVELKRSRGRPAALPPPVKFYGFPDQVYAAYQNAGFLADLQLALEELFARVYYLGPLREYPRRQYVWAGAQPSDVGRLGELAVGALLAARDRGQLVSRGPRKHRQPLESVIGYWLKELGLISSFEVRSIAEGSGLYQVLVKKTYRSAQVAITDVGVGVSQVLPVLVLCYYVPEGSTIIFEQPEIHLHPSVQAGLADVLIDAVKTRGVQLIVESHSEHLLRRLQRRIAEEKLSPADAALYFCDAPAGASQITELELDTYGNITNWPPDFFGDDMGDLASMTEAAMRRQLTAS